MFDSRRSDGSGSVATSASSLSETEFQIFVNSRNSPARGPCCSSSSDGILQQRFQHGPDIGVAGGLISRQRTGIAPQQRQMFSNEL